jgi:hypothetical protein
MLMLFHFRIEARYPTGALWILNRVSAVVLIPRPFFFRSSWFPFVHLLPRYLPCLLAHSDWLTLIYPRLRFCACRTTRRARLRCCSARSRRRRRSCRLIRWCVLATPLTFHLHYRLSSIRCYLTRHLLQY